MTDELSQEECDTLASQLREIADEIESETTYLNYLNGDVDVTNHFDRHGNGGFLVHGKSLDWDISTPRFDVCVDIEDHDP